MYKSIIIFLIGAFTAYAIYAATGLGFTSYNIQFGWTTTVSEFSICKDVKNASTFNLFVPTKTQAEYESLISYPPTNITITNAGDPTNCCPPTNGKACTWAN